ncbi:MAG: hypothetical protein R3A12_15420 [Ignavibacteria bacterium]
MEDIVEKLNDIGKLEAPPKMEGKQLYAYFLPDKNKIQIYKDHLEKEKGGNKKSVANTEVSENTEEEATPNIISEENKPEENKDA